MTTTTEVFINEQNKILEIAGANTYEIFLSFLPLLKQADKLNNPRFSMNCLKYDGSRKALIATDATLMIMRNLDCGNDDFYVDPKYLISMTQFKKIGLIKLPILQDLSFPNYERILELLIKKETSEFHFSQPAVDTILKSLTKEEKRFCNLKFTFHGYNRALEVELIEYQNKTIKKGFYALIMGTNPPQK